MEDICALLSMESAAQRLADLGYKLEANVADEEDEDNPRKEKVGFRPDSPLAK